MKKKVSRAKTTARPASRSKVKRTAPRASSRRTTRSSSSMTFVPVTVRRFFLITTCLVLAVVAVLVFNKKPVTQSVAGVSVARGLFNQATITMPTVPGVDHYNIYFKEVSDKRDIKKVNGVRVAKNVPTYTISYLKKGAQYEYVISAAYANTGKEFWWSDVKPLTNLQSM